MALARRGNAAATRRGSFRSKVVHNSQQQIRKESSYGHLLLPRGVGVFKEEVGRIALDILPYFVTDERHPDRDDDLEIAGKGDLWYKRPYKLHRWSDGGKMSSVVCLTSVGKKCPICEYHAKRIGEGAEWKDKEMSSMRPSDRNLYYVVPRGGSKKYDEKPYLWDISNFSFQKALDNETAENDEFGDFPGLEDGLTLNIRFSDEKIERTSFAKASRIDFAARDYVYKEELVSALTSLDEVLDIKDYREVDRLFFATGDDDDPPADDDPADDDPPADIPEASPRRPTSRPPPQERDREIATRSAPARSSLTESKNDRKPSEPEPKDDKLPERRRQPDPDMTVAAKLPGKQIAPVAPASGNGAVVGECPSGYEFGVDVDAKPECEDCPVWGDCMDAKQEGVRS